MAHVYFLQGTSAAYAQLTPVSNIFYATTDTNELYFGSKKLTNAADLAAVISRIAVNEGNIATIMGDVNTQGSMLYIAKTAVDSLDNQLADIAKSGAAEDVSIEDTAGNLTATNVEDALAEIVDKIDGVEDVGAVTMSHSPGSLVYDFYQGGQDVAHKIGTITIPEDMFVTSGELIYPDGNHPITIDGQQITSGTYIKMIIGETDPLYINVTDLIEYNDVQSTTEIVLSNTNHVISGTIGEVSGSKLSNGSVTETKLDSSVQTKLGLASVILGTSSDTATANTVYGAKAAASDAQNDVDNLSDYVGTIPSTAQATTIVGYAEELASTAMLEWGSF